MFLLMAAAAAAIAMPTCQGADDCAVKWGRATQWVLAHGTALDKQSDTFMATVPVEQSGQNSFQVTRIPTSATGAVLDLRIGCANEFRCRWEDMKRDFTASVMGDGQ